MNFRPALHRWLLVSVLASAVGLFFTLSTFVPIQVDAGWYAYPALALHEGRDPGENQLTAEALLAERPGRKARFYWDSRRNLYVLPTLAWFDLAGTSWRSLHGYGLLQLLLFSAVSWQLFKRYGGDRRTAVACWAILCGDHVLVANAATDARPDISLGILAMLLFLAIAQLLEDHERRAPAIAIGLLVALLLPLVHLTSLAAIGLVSVYAALYSAAAPRARSRLGPVVAVLAVAIAAFAVRRDVLDLLIPSATPETFAQNPFDMLSKKFDHGIAAPFRIELSRWLNYLWPSNFALFLIPAAALALRFARRGRTERDVFSDSLALGSLCGVAIVTVCSPSPRVDHLITLIPFIVLAASRILGSRELPAIVWPAVFVLAVCGKLLHAGYVIERYDIKAGIRNTTVEAFFSDLFPRERPVLVVGPSEIWPYIPADRNVVIDDNRNNMFDFSSDRWRRVDFVVLNREYANYRWRERFAARFPELQLDEIRYLGERNGPLSIGVYRVVKREPD